MIEILNNLYVRQYYKMQATVNLTSNLNNICLAMESKCET